MMHDGMMWGMGFAHLLLIVLVPAHQDTINAGTTVTDRSAAAAMAKVLVKASGLNSRPSWASSVKIGRKRR